MKKSKRSNKKSKEEEMTLVDCYYIPSVIAEQFQLLREHCAVEVEKELALLFSKVVREYREEVGQVVVSYDDKGNKTCEIPLSPIEVSKTKDYPLHTRYEVESIYDKNRQTYIYDLKKSDIFFLVSDGKDKNGENDILKAIKLAGNKDIYFIRWDNEQQL